MDGLSGLGLGLGLLVQPKRRKLVREVWKTSMIEPTEMILL